MDITKRYDIKRCKYNKAEDIEDIVITEYPLTIFLNGKEFVTLHCTPTSLEYLVVGYLFSEGIIEEKEDIESLKLDMVEGRAYISTKIKDDYLFLGDKLCAKRTVTTACGKSKTILYNVMEFLGTDSEKIKNSFVITNQEIIHLILQFNKKSQLFIETGGVHSSALCNKEGILLFEEDIGRHNALDKILGCALLDGVAVNDKIIVTSGRVSSEMIIKVIKQNIPILISRSAPTDLSIELARKFNLTLIGFARGERFNVYNNFDYIIV